VTVKNKQRATEQTFNDGFPSRKVDTDVKGKFALRNDESGDYVENPQQAINDVFDTIGMLGEGDPLRKTYSSTEVIASGDSRKEAIEKLDARFNDSTGHSHSGAPGDGAPISAQNLSNTPLRAFVKEGPTLENVTGTSVDVSSSLVGKVPSTSETQKGVVVSSPYNRIIIRDKDGPEGDDRIVDSTGRVVFGRLTHAAGVWTLSFFTTEGAFEIIEPRDLKWFYQEIFDAIKEGPVYNEFFNMPSDSVTADVVDATATQRGLVSTEAQEFSGEKTFLGKTIFQSGTEGVEALEVSFDPASSSLLSENVEEAIKELDGETVKLTGDQTISGVKSFEDEIELTELSATPSLPAAGKKKFYAKDDGLIYSLDSDGNETPVGSGTGGLPIVTHFDPVIETSSFPLGASYTVDGVSLENGDTVLAPKMSNRVYLVSGVGSEIVFDAVGIFQDRSEDPVSGEAVRIQKGVSFKNQIAVFDGTDFKINDTIRLFDGLNFQEISSIKTTTLANNATTEVFRVSSAGSQNMILNYSFTHVDVKEAGQVILTVAGSGVEVVKTSAGNGSTLEFSGAIDSGDLVLSATITDLGSSATLKYFVTRWSDQPGGPTGIPNYGTGAPAPSAAAGSVGEIQFKGADDLLAADSRLHWSASDATLSLGDLKMKSMGDSLSILDDRSTFETLLSWPDDKYFHAILEYSVRRGGDFRTGRFLIANNDTGDVEANEDFIESSPTGVAFQIISDGGEIKLQYISDNQSVTGSFKYSLRGWK
jgi:hypothetical protein